MIILDKVSKYYHLSDGGIHYVMKDLSLDIPKGKNIAVLGPNGAGKSTLLRLIGGAEAPNSGTITSEGNISWPLGVGVGFQGSLTGRQNIEFVCKINGLSQELYIEAVQFVLEFSELGKFFDNPVKTYSSGMRARLAFGLSIAFDFDYYLIDELTAVGDAVFRQKAQQAFKEIKKRATLIFVAHNLQMLKDNCEAAIYLNEGNATYYPDLSDGIAAYQEYISKKTTTSATPGLGEQEAAKQEAAKQEAAKQEAAKQVAKKQVAKKQVAKKQVAKKQVAKKQVAKKQVAGKKSISPVRKTATNQPTRTKLEGEITKRGSTEKASAKEVRINPKLNDEN